jgi:CRP-like cAMP-binding protein
MAVLKCGDFFGGKGLFNNLPSVATVEAEDNLICFTMTRNDFEEELTPVVNKLRQAANQYRLFIDKQI